MIKNIIYIIGFLELLSCNNPKNEKVEISKNGILYCVAKDKQTILAIKNDSVIWQNNIISTLGKPKVGSPEIRDIKLSNDTLKIVFGKHDFAFIDINTGKATYLGAD